MIDIETSQETKHLTVKTVVIRFQILDETKTDILVTDGLIDGGVWLPKSALEIAPAPTAGLVIVTLPEWLAQEKGLL